MKNKKGIIVSNTLNLKNGAGNSRSIYYATEELKERGYSVNHISGRSVVNLFYGLRSIFKALKPNSNKFIIFNSLASISYGNKFWIFYLFFAWLFKFKIYVNWYETADYLDHYLPKRPQWFKFCFTVLKRVKVEHIIASKAAQSTIDKFFPGASVHLIYNCTKINIDVSEDQNLFKHPTIVNVGSIQFRKGYDLFIETAIEACRTHPTVHFYWIGSIGDHVLFDKFESQVVASGFSSRIKWIGKIEYPEVLLSKSSMLFLSSRYDTMPLAMIEAMALGKEVISFYSGGAEEVLNGEMLVADLSIKKASERILNYLSNRNEDYCNEELILRYKNNFTPAVYVDKLLKIIR